MGNGQEFGGWGTLEFSTRSYLVPDTCWEKGRVECQRSVVRRWLCGKV